MIISATVVWVVTNKISSPRASRSSPSATSTSSSSGRTAITSPWIHDAATLGRGRCGAIRRVLPQSPAREMSTRARLRCARPCRYVDALLFAELHLIQMPAERDRQVERQKVAISRDAAPHPLLPYVDRTALSRASIGRGRRAPSRRVHQALARATPSSRDVILCLENHYKVGDWLYAEFAQMEDVFLEVIRPDPLAPFRRAGRSVERRRWLGSIRSPFWKRSRTVS